MGYDFLTPGAVMRSVMKVTVTLTLLVVIVLLAAVGPGVLKQLVFLAALILGFLWGASLAFVIFTYRVSQSQLQDLEAQGYFKLVLIALLSIAAVASFAQQSAAACIFCGEEMLLVLIVLLFLVVAAVVAGIFFTSVSQDIAHAPSNPSADNGAA